MLPSKKQSWTLLLLPIKSDIHSSKVLWLLIESTSLKIHHAYVQLHEYLKQIPDLLNCTVYLHKLFHTSFWWSTSWSTKQREVNLKIYLDFPSCLWAPFLNLIYTVKPKVSKVRNSKMFPTKHMASQPLYEISWAKKNYRPPFRKFPQIC